MNRREIFGGNVRSLNQIVGEIEAKPRQQLNDDPHWVISRLKEAFGLIEEGDAGEVKHPKVLATHLAVSFALLSDNTASMEPPNQVANDPKFRDWLLTMAINALVLGEHQRAACRGAFLRSAEAYLGNWRR